MVITALLNVYCPSVVYFAYLPDFEVQFCGRSFPEISTKHLKLDTYVFFHSVMKLNKQKYSHLKQLQYHFTISKVIKKRYKEQLPEDLKKNNLSCLNTAFCI